MNSLKRSEVFDKNLTEKFVQFCCENLKAFPNKLEIDEYLVNDNTTGLCVDFDDDNFLILVRVKNRNLTQIYTTIAHELVHVKQHMYDNLNDLLLYNNGNLNTWWEKEAYEKSDKLVENFITFFQNSR